MKTTARIFGLLHRAARVGGFDVIRRNFYSPIPDLNDLPPDVFERRSQIAGIAWEADRHEALLRALKPFLDEYEPPAGFRWDNPMYGPVEIELLHALIRRERPARVVELGSGWSSLTIDTACRRNAKDRAPCEYRAFDPYPRDTVKAALNGQLDILGACDVPEAVFTALEAGDVLFVDTTHTVKVGGDVNRIILDVLPTLAPGVLVHVHDVFLPYEYPRDFIARHCYWQEQYLLQALLADNPKFEIVFPAWAFTHERRTVIDEVFPQHRERVLGPGAFWLRRTG